MSNIVIKINGTRIKSPTACTVGIFRISKSGRLSSGKMVMDIIAQKQRIDLTWSVLTGAQLNQIIALLDSGVFYQVEYPDPKVNAAQVVKTMYVGDLNQTLFRAAAHTIWKDITIPFIEQ